MCQGKIPMNAVVLGAGLAGLSCAYELSKNGFDVTVLERDGDVGGLAKSFKYKNFTYDLGPHRFHTKYNELVKEINDIINNNFDIKIKQTRIFFMNKFFNYPLSIKDVLFGFDIITSTKCMSHFVYSHIENKLKRKKEISFEDYVKNRFGSELYNIYFRYYTKKVWGISGSEISVDWASQRIPLVGLKDLLVKTFMNSINLVKGTEHTHSPYLSEFYYPKNGGIGIISKKLSENVIKNKGKINLNTKIEKISLIDNKINSISYIHDNKKITKKFDYILSTIPINDFIQLTNPKEDYLINAISNLKFRSIIFVYIIINKPKVTDDHWVYFPEKDVITNRTTEYKNFSLNNAPENKTIISAEITCDSNDPMWKNTNIEDIKNKVVEDLTKFKLFNREDVDDIFIRKEREAYPISDIKYKENLEIAKNYLYKIENLIFFGRNALFAYNNMDHSIKMGFLAAKSIIDNKKYNIEGVGQIGEFN